MKTINYCQKEFGLRHCEDPTSASECYKSDKLSSTKTLQTNSFFSSKQILLETRRSGKFFISLIQLFEKKFIKRYKSRSIEEHENEL